MRNEFDIWVFEWFLQKLGVHPNPWNSQRLKEYINRFERKV